MSKGKLSTSKKFVIVMMVISMQLIFFTEFATIYLQDTSALVGIIGAVIPASISLVAYMLKAKAENSAGGLTYDMAMLEAQLDSDDDDDSEVLG